MPAYAGPKRKCKEASPSHNSINYAQSSTQVMLLSQYNSSKNIEDWSTCTNIKTCPKSAQLNQSREGKPLHNADKKTNNLVMSAGMHFYSLLVVELLAHHLTCTGRASTSSRPSSTWHVAVSPYWHEIFQSFKLPWNISSMQMLQPKISVTLLAMARISDKQRKTVYCIKGAGRTDPSQNIHLGFINQTSIRPHLDQLS